MKQKLLQKIHFSSYIHPKSLIIGNVIIGKNVFIAPNVVLRADEPNSKIVIGNFCNIQDGVVIHSLSNSSVIINEKTSITHLCLIHGPCKIGTNCFIGFRSTIFDSIIENNVVIKNCCLIEHTKIVRNSLVFSGTTLSGKNSINKFPKVDKKTLSFTKTVLETNFNLIKNYKTATFDIDNKK